MLDCCRQALSRIDISGEQATKAIVYGLFQVLLASEVAFCRQDGGVTEKKLYLLQFAAVHMAELCAGSPKVVRCGWSSSRLSAQLRTTYQTTFRIYRYPKRFRDD